MQITAAPGHSHSEPGLPAREAASHVPARHNRFGWVWTFGVGIVLALAAVWISTSRHAGHASKGSVGAPAAAEATVVTVANVEAREVQHAVEVVGSLFGRDEISLTAKVGGRVVKIYHDVGDVVRPGDVLLEIDPTDYQLAVEEARRGLELELARLGLTELPTAQFNVKQLPMVARAHAEEQNAASRLQRISQLSRTGSIAGEERDATEKSMAVAQASYQQALLDAQTSLATVRHRQAALDTALQRLRDTQLVVPGASLAKADKSSAPRTSDTENEYVVALREVAEGENISSSGAGETLLFELVIDRPLKLKATVPERHRSELALGQQVDIRVEYFAGEMFHGEVSRVSPAVDRANRTFGVEVLVPNADRRLSAGSFARAKILTHVDPAAITIPEEAIVLFAGVTKVFVVDRGVARETPIKIQRSLKIPGMDNDKSWVEVSGELHPGMQVVTSGHSRLSDGAAVRLRTSEIAQK